MLLAQSLDQVGGDLAVEAFDTTLDLLEWVDYVVGGGSCVGHGAAIRGACPRRCVIPVLR